jgi:hypothetical protein
MGDSMTDFHQNIFYYYRGAKQSGPERDQQLEDNTTKALLNTLQHCSPVVAAKLLGWVGITAPGRTEFALQKSTIGGERIRSKSQRLLLGIVGQAQAANESICNQLTGAQVTDGRPDAWLYGEDFVVLIESKVGASVLEPNQMSCHGKKLRPYVAPRPRCRVLTWAQVHKFFVALLPDLRDKNKWLVEQFTQYLEWTGMTEFVGFEEGIFEFFVHSDKDPDAKKWVRDTMRALAEKVLYGDQGLKAFDRFYEGYHIGRFGPEDDHYWVAFGPKEFKQSAHQTISLYEYGLEVFVNVELLPVIKKLREKIQSNEPLFRQVISQLPPPFTVQIRERKRRKKGVMDYDDYIIAAIETGIYEQIPYGLDDPQSPGFEYIRALLQQIEYPYLSIRRRIDRKRVLEPSGGNGEALVNEVIGVLKAFHPVVHFINQ